MLNNIISQSFEGQEIRIAEVNNEIYFVGKDVAEALGYANSRQALADHVWDEFKADVQFSDGSQNRTMIAISEQGVYQLVFGSKKPEARKFQKWVIQDVLPSIRTKGTYSIVPTSPVPSTPAELMLQNAQLMVAQERKLTQLESQLESQQARLTKVDERTEQFEIPSGYETVNSYLATLNTCTVSSGNACSTTRLGMYLARNDYPKYPTKVWDSKSCREVNAYEKGAIEDALQDLIKEGTLICYLPFRGKLQVRVHNEKNLPAKRKASYSPTEALDLLFPSKVVPCAEEVEAQLNRTLYPRNVMTSPSGLEHLFLD